MTFANALVLLALLALPLLVAWYGRQQRQRARAAEAFVAPKLTPSVAPHRPRWRRHLPMFAFALALVLLAAAGSARSSGRLP
jgi:Ca-activated chloride channel family protein